MQRVAVFVDYQNVYKRARECFGWSGMPHMIGQVDPVKLGVRLAAGADRKLTHLGFYRGMPSSKHDAKGFGACQRQVSAWERQKVAVTTRPLNYRNPLEPKEKGIDVRIALDFVMMAMRDEYDVGILFSADTDLLPALESVREIKGPGAVEVAAWVPDYGYANRLQIDQMWCHLLKRDDFHHLFDPTDYTKARR